MAPAAFWAIFLGMGVFVMSHDNIAAAGQDKPPHPGIIVEIDMCSGAQTARPVDQVSELLRYVPVNGRMEPVVLTRSYPRDAGGKLVPQEYAHHIDVVEYGVNGQALRNSVINFIDRVPPSNPPTSGCVPHP